MQVFDLRRLRTIDRATAPVILQADAHYAEFGDAHNIVINEVSGYAYAVGTDTCAGGLHMIDIRTPTAPSFVNCYQTDGYIHDAQCVTYRGPDLRYQAREICVNSSVDELSVVDVTDKTAPQRLGAVHDEDSAYIHQSWLSEDQRYVVMNDEMDEWFSNQNTRSYIIDVQQLDAPRIIGQYTAASPAIDHNLYISDTYLYEANYTSGLRVLDGKALAQGALTEVAFFDTFPDHDEPVFSGAWTAYPYFRNGTVVVTTLDRGVFLLKPHLTPNALVASIAPTVRVCVDSASPPPLSLPFVVQPRDGYTQSVALAATVQPPMLAPIVTPTLLSAVTSVPLTGSVQFAPASAHTGPYTVTVTAQSTGDLSPAATTIHLHLAATTPAALTALTATTPLTTTPTVLFWSPRTDAAAYLVEFAADAAFTQLLAQTETVMPSYTLPHPLALNRTYWWRVTPLNGCGAGPATTASLASANGVFLPIISNEP
jgi:choice-of-anchor B domain-containing protein